MPLLGDTTLVAVQHISQTIRAGFRDVPVLGLEGHAQQRSGRPSHRITVAGVLTGPTALDDLAALQALATSGEETTFAADIVTALDLQQVVVTRFEATERAGRPGVLDYRLEVVESPPLPPPAQLSAFGALDDFGLGDLGFDTDILGDLEGLAGDIAGAVDAALEAVAALDALAGLASFDFQGVLDPAARVSDSVTEVAEGLQTGVAALGELFGS
jgi:hypothetical protein